MKNVIKIFALGIIAILVVLPYFVHPDGAFQLVSEMEEKARSC